jgi:UDP-glucuronate 4-epimerase
MKIIVTGAAGFIGYHVSKRLLDAGNEVVGIDNLNDYYDPALKSARLEILNKNINFHFYKLDICDFTALKECIGNAKIIIHLAAQAGVRYSLENPFSYVQSNVVGHLNILEVCRNIKDFERLIYASSSSVYGQNTKMPFSVEDRVDQPASLYAATKRADELMSHTYAHLYGINTIGLRFFTVYGEYGRPDMAPMKFTKKIIDGDVIDVYNHGDLKRDFTYIDDVVDGVIASIRSPLDGNKIYNLGNNNPEKLMDFISILEKHIGKKAVLNMMSMQKGDVYETYADITESKRDLNFSPKTSLDLGLKKTVEWFRKFYGF